jgi:Tol biopolymer transport system component
MSPEQARGLAVDKRTDIWAFGCVLFEMLSGRRAFEGATITDTFARILDHEPDWAALPASTPERIRELLRRCLQKDPQKRLRDIADASLDIGDGEAPGAAGPYASTRESGAGQRRRGARIAEIAAAFLIGALLVGGSLRLWDRPPRVGGGDSLQFTIGPPPSTVFPFQNFAFAIAPDGRHLAMVAFADNTLALWVRSFGSGEPRRLRGTERALAPFWSPDSRQIAFLAGGKLKTVGLNGEEPFDVCDVTAGGNAGGTWNRDGTILLGSLAGPLQKVTATGGTPTAVTALKEADTSHRYPWFLPDGEHFLFLAIAKGAHQLRVGSLSSTDSTPLGSIRSNAIYAAGRLLFVQGGLVAQPFDPRSRELTGEPFPLNDHMTLKDGRGAFSVSETGLLGYSARPPRVLSRLTWMDRSGKALEHVGEDDSYFDLALSPDDRSVAISSMAADGNIDIWRIDFARPGDKRRITSDAGLEFHPDWSGHGMLSFTSDRSGLNKVFRRPSDGSGKDELIAEGSGVAAQSVWSPDGKSLIYRSEGADLWTQSVDGGQTPAVFVNTPFAEHSPVFSPDGRWIAYCSDRTGRYEIYVRPFPSKDPEHKVSLNGGKMPRWRADREIFFLALDGRLMSARFNAAANPPTAVPQQLFQTDLGNEPIWNRPYDVTRNGQRFLIPIARDVRDARLITIVTDWTANLRR